MMHNTVLNLRVLCGCGGRVPDCHICHGERSVTLGALLDTITVAGLQEVIERVTQMLNVKTRGETEMLTMEEVATLKKVTRRTVYMILNDEYRCAKIFPHARFEGQGKNGVWRIPRAEAEAWTPRKDKSRE